MSALTIPTASGGLKTVELGEPARLDTRSTPPTSRQVYAAAHVVADPLRASAEGATDQIDWDATLELRRRLWSLGLGVAEAMDTSQRGMGLDWPSALELARRTMADAQAVGGRVIVGIATDQLPAGPADLGAIRDAYLEQLEAIETAGGEVVLMASRQLAASAASADDYRKVYDAVIGQAGRPVTLHWLGAAFDQSLAGYWGSADPTDATQVVLDLINDHAEKVRGIKVSLLNAEFEQDLRSRMPAGPRVFTGDDYNYVDLIAGDGQQHSDALLGAFAAVAPFASAAFGRLDEGDVAGYRAILGPTEALSRLIFTAPTQFYKVGVAWLAYLTGQQSHFRMISGFETGRSLGHLGELVLAADRIGLFGEPEFTAKRAAGYFAAQGIG